MRIVRSLTVGAEILVSGQCPPQLRGAVLCDLAQLDQEIDILLSQARRRAPMPHAGRLF